MEMKNTAENFSKEAEEKSDAWHEYRFGEMISLRGVLDIVDLTPSAKSKIFAGFDHIPSNRNAIREHVYYFKEMVASNVRSHEMRGMLFFNKWELINWMEKEAESDPDFIYMLPQDFVEFCRKKQAMPSYSELLKENRELKQKNETLEKEIKRLQKKDSGVRDRSKIRIFVEKLAAQIKKDTAKNHIAADGVMISAILMFLDLEADAYGTVIDSERKEVKGLSLSFLRKTLIEENLLSTNNKVGKKSKEMREKEAAALRMIADLFEEAQYRKLYRESEEIQKMLKCKK